MMPMPGTYTYKCPRCHGSHSVVATVDNCLDGFVIDWCSAYGDCRSFRVEIRGIYSDEQLAELAEEME